MDYSFEIEPNLTNYELDQHLSVTSQHSNYKWNVEYIRLLLICIMANPNIGRIVSRQHTIYILVGN